MFPWKCLTVVLVLLLPGGSLVLLLAAAARALAVAKASRRADLPRPRAAQPGKA